MKVVVTGGAGFIGANLCRALAARDGIEVLAFDDLSSGRRENLDGVEAELVVGDILDVDAIGEAVAGAWSVVHLAARPSVPLSIDDPVTSHEVNATGTVRVLEAARTGGVGHVVVASSSAVYGAAPEVPKHEGMATVPVSPYGSSKLATESHALAWQASYGIGVLAFRFFNVFGPLQPAGHAYAAVVPAFVDAALAGRPLSVHGDGSQTRDFAYVGTVAGVLADSAVGHVTHEGPVNLAFGSRVSLLELIERLEVAVGHPLDREHRPTRAGDVHDSQADDSRLRGLFPDATPVSLDDGLAATVEWFRTLVP